MKSDNIEKYVEAWNTAPTDSGLEGHMVLISSKLAYHTGMPWPKNWSGVVHICDGEGRYLNNNLDCIFCKVPLTNRERNLARLIVGSL